MPGTPRLVILDGFALNPGDLSWNTLQALAQVEIHDRTPADEVVARSAGAQLLLTNKTPLAAEAIEQLPGLRYIGVMATGYNIVDVAACRAHGVVVTNVPTYGTCSVAQYAIALLLELCHHVGEHAASVRRGDWQRSPDWSYWTSPLVELAGKTLGVVGFGRIGRQTARIAAALGMNIVAHDESPGEDPQLEGFRWCGLEELLAVSDVVSLHCPLTPATHSLINRDRLGRMRRHAFLINTARGPLVDVEALAEALRSGRIAGAALDVVPEEPPVHGNPLFALPNCIVTPHIAWATIEARRRLLDTVVDNVAAFLAGRPRNVVS